MQHKKGFTLVEVIIAMLVTTILLTAVYTIFIRINNINIEQNEFVQVQDGLRNVGLYIEKDIRKSNQSLEITNSPANCYSIKDLVETDVNKNTVLYCLTNDVVTRNGQYLIDSVSQLEIKHESFYIEMIIKGEYQGKEIVHDKKIYLR